MRAVGQGHGNGDLVPQADRLAGEEGDAATQLRQLLMQRLLDPVELVPRRPLLVAVADAVQQGRGQAREGRLPATADPALGGQLQIEAEHRRGPRRDFGEGAQMGWRQQPIDSAGHRRGRHAQLLDDPVPHFRRIAVVNADRDRGNPHLNGRSPTPAAASADRAV